MNYAFLTILLVYLSSTVSYILRLISGYTRLSAVGLRLIVVGAVLQFVVLLTHITTSPGPLVLGYLEYFQASSLLLAVVFVFLCFTKRFYGSGPFFITMIDVFCCLSLSMKSPYTLTLISKGSGYLFLHMVALFLSLPVFSLSFIVAVMFLLSEWQIKNKRFDGITARFPPLEVLDQVHYRSLYFGFIFFTLVIITGAGYEKIKTGHYITGDFKQVLSILSWFIFAALLNLRVRKGLLGHRGVVLSIIGFASVILSFLVGFSG